MFADADEQVGRAHVGSPPREGGGRAYAHAGHPLRLEQRSAQVTEAGKTSLRHHLCRGLGRNVEDAADGPVVVEERTVGIHEVTVLGVPVAVQDEVLVLLPRRPPGRQHGVEHRPDEIPYLGPHLAHR